VRLRNPVVQRGDPAVSIALPRPGEFWQGFLKNESRGVWRGAGDEILHLLFSFGLKRYIGRRQIVCAKITTDRIIGNMPAKEFLTAREVARYLRVNQYTVYRLVTQKKLPAVKVGSQWRFRRRVLDRWLESQLTLPRDQ